jgi:peroxiredoxin Q/BCP
MAETPRAGDSAPSFSLPSTRGEISLEGLREGGRFVIVAFYAEDGTPSCEHEVAMLKDAHDTLVECGASVVAISADTVASHERFAARLGGVPFPLASDQALDAATAWGAVDAADPRRARRAVFVVDRDGSVSLALPHFQPGNPSQVEAILTAVGAG